MFFLCSFVCEYVAFSLSPFPINGWFVCSFVRSAILSFALSLILSPLFSFFLLHLFSSRFFLLFIGTSHPARKPNVRLYLNFVVVVVDVIASYHHCYTPLSCKRIGCWMSKNFYSRDIIFPICPSCSLFIQKCKKRKNDSQEIVCTLHHRLN